jgi:hypothetical protein
MKKFYQSKTFWFFVLSLVVSVAGLFGFADYQPSPQQAEIAGIIVSVVGILLRFFTEKPVEL